MLADGGTVGLEHLGNVHDQVLHGHDEPRQHAEADNHPQVALEHVLQVGRRDRDQVDDLQVVQPGLEPLPPEAGHRAPLEVADAEHVEAAADHVRGGERLDIRGMHGPGSQCGLNAAARLRAGRGRWRRRGRRGRQDARRHRGFHLGRQVLDHAVVRAGQPEASPQVQGEVLGAERAEFGRQRQRVPRVQVNADVAQLQAPVEPERPRRAEHRELRLDGEQRLARRQAPGRHVDRLAELRAQGLGEQEGGVVEQRRPLQHELADRRVDPVLVHGGEQVTAVGERHSASPFRYAVRGR